MRLPSLPLQHEHDREILRLAVPAFGALVAEPLFLLADSAIVGHLGTPQLAGLGVAATVLATAVSLSVFLAYGTTATVARLLGAGDEAGALRRGIDGLWLALALGGAFSLVGFVAGATLIGWFDAGVQASAEARHYFEVSLLGVPAALVILAMTGSLRGLQDTRTPLVVAAAANIANIGLNYGLVYGAGLGISGSALGTVIAQWGAAGAHVRVVARAAKTLSVSLRPDWLGVRDSFTASAPLLLRNLSLRIVIAGAAAVAARMGTAEIAAHQIAFN